VSVLDRKLLRDILAMRGQVITISLVIAAGIAVFVSSISTYDSLRYGRDRFYLAARFPQLFVTLKRAPLSVVAQVHEIPGVAAVQPRIVRDVIINRPTSLLPVSARVVSIENAGDEPLVRLFMRRGTAPLPGDTKNVAINEAFAEANGVTPGEGMRVVLNGRVQIFQISGIGLSPEFIYSVKPGLPIPDDRLYAIIWIDRRPAEAAFDMKGAFNDLAVSLAPGTNPQSVIAELDRLLEPYGSVGAIERRDQPSNRFLEDELNQQKVMSITIPFIFFGVAAFLLNVTLGRLVAAQREQIAALKALGFNAIPIAAHYLKLVTIIILLASVLGIPAGIAFGEAMIASYHGFFRLPTLVFELTPWSVAAGIGASFVMAAIGVLSSLRSVMILAPAVAMRPASPMRFRRSWVESIAPVFKPRYIMIFRNIAGRPVRTLLTIAGIAFAVPMVVLGLFWRDAIDHMIEVQFNLVERGNVVVTFPHPFDRGIVGDLSREPGVLAVEGQRIVPVRLRAGHRSHLTSVIGLPSRSELRRPHDAALRLIEVPPEGITLTRRLADRLGVKPGDTITIEVMEGRRRKRDLPVSASVDEVIGMASYMPIAALNQLTGEGDVVSAAAIYADASTLSALSQRFKNLPVIESVAMKSYTLASFIDKIANLVLVTAGILTLFGVIIAVGVVYNSARIGLQERAWELASLRVLGFSRAEVARILFSEFALEIVVGVPLGLAVSKGIISLIAHFHSNESFQIPGVIGARTYAVSALIVIASALASAYVVRRRIDRLDLVSVLKTRD
jgi:putative ABC transport system permease protein